MLLVCRVWALCSWWVPDAGPAYTWKLSSSDVWKPACPGGSAPAAPDPPERLTLLLPEPVCMCYQLQVLPTDQGKLQQLACVGCCCYVGEQRQQCILWEVCQLRCHAVPVPQETSKNGW